MKTTDYENHQRDIPLKLRVDIFKVTCLSILLYGSGAWTLTKAMSARLNSYATSCYRYMLGIRRIDRVRNEKVLEAVGQIPLSTCVKRRQLRWLGHALRAPEGNTMRLYALYAPAHGKRKRGRPRLQFRTYIEQLTGFTSSWEVSSAAQDRVGWRKLVVDCTSGAVV